MPTITVPPLSRNTIRRFAKHLRGQLGLSSIYIDLGFLLEVLTCPLGTMDHPLVEMEIVEDRSLPGKYAAYYPQSNLLKIRETVYLGACAGNGRDRFTIAHELGHFFLHREVSLNLAREASPDQTVPAYLNPEWQANTFASEFLMPHDLIQGMSPEEVAQACGTSHEAARIALNT